MAEFQDLEAALQRAINAEQNRIGEAKQVLLKEKGSTALVQFAWAKLEEWCDPQAYYSFIKGKDIKFVTDYKPRKLNDGEVDAEFDKACKMCLQALGHEGDDQYFSDYITRLFVVEEHGIVVDDTPLRQMKNRLQKGESHFLEFVVKLNEAYGNDQIHQMVTTLTQHILPEDPKAEQAVYQRWARQLGLADRDWESIKNRVARVPYNSENHPFNKLREALDPRKKDDR